MLLWLLLYRASPTTPWAILNTYADHATLIADGPTQLAGKTSGQAAAAQITDAYAISDAVTFTAIPLV